MTKIYLDGYMDVPEDAIDKVKLSLTEHIKLTKSEKGCEKFEVNLSNTKAGRFEVSEIFSSKESFDAHQERVKNSDWGNITKGYPRHYTVEEK